jgi:hypothetical protein
VNASAALISYAAGRIGPLQLAPMAIMGYPPTMDKVQWAEFCKAREEYRGMVQKLDRAVPQLRSLQQRLVDERGGGAFTVETPVVYNAALDEADRDYEPKIILVADNPGRREQAADQRRYLVGPSGKLADGFFRSRPELGVDFRKNVLILNKTPIHTPRTAELRELARLGGSPIAAAIEESQSAMVDIIRRFHLALSGRPKLWIIGYSEMGPGKLFGRFSSALSAAYPPEDPLRNTILLFRHFSMNQFSVDIRKRTVQGEALETTLDRVGADYRKRILGW